jgi:hypothetical protein
MYILFLDMKLSPFVFLVLFLLINCKKDSRKSTHSNIIEAHISKIDTHKPIKKTILNNNIYPMVVDDVNYTMVVTPCAVQSKKWEALAQQKFIF